jgi:Effector-associated domain 11
MTLQEKLQALIGKAKTQEALDVLTEQLQGTEEGDDIVLLRSRWNRNRQSYNMGLLTHGDYGMEMNRINYALLSIVSDLDESSTTRRTTTHTKAEAAITNIYNTYIVDNSVTTTVHGDNVGGDKIIDNRVDNSVKTTRIIQGDAVKGNKSTTHIGGDYVGGDKVGGDKVMGNKNTTTTIDNHVEQKDPSVSEPKKVILFIAANPSGKNETNSTLERQTLTDAHNQSSLREQYMVIDHFASNISDLLRLLKKHKPSIVHLCMHGAKDGMYFENADGSVDLVAAEVLASFFELLNMREKSIKCVILNACNSDSQAEAVNQYVDYTVGMKGAIPPAVGIEYTKGFYESFLEDEDYESAHLSSVALLGHFAKKIGWDGEVAIKDMPRLFKTKG